MEVKPEILNFNKIFCYSLKTPKFLETHIKFIKHNNQKAILLFIGLVLTRQSFSKLKENKSELRPLIIFGVIGTFLGALAIKLVPANILTKTLGVVLIFYPIFYFTLLKRLRLINIKNRLDYREISALFAYSKNLT